MAQEYLKVGKPDTKMDAPSHTPGVNAGNDPGGIEQDPGIEYTGERGQGKPTARSTARMSTSINAKKRNPIDSSMPNMPPA